MKKTLCALMAAAALGAGAVTSSEIDSSIGKAVAFLLAQQAEDGHFSDPGTPALTALPLWAFSATRDCAGVDTNAMAKAMASAAKYVLAAQKADGGFYVDRRPTKNKATGSGGPGGLSTYNTAVCLSALFESGLAPAEPLLRAREFLAKSQLDGEDTTAGGFGYGRADAKRRYGDLSNTSYALDAMRRTEKLEELRMTGKRVDVNWDAALKFVENLQSKEGERKGGAAYNERTPQAGGETNRSGKVSLMAYGSMSYAAVLSMSHAKLTRGDPRVKNALGYCEKYWSVDENPGMGSQGLFYYYDIMTRALAAAQVDRVGDHEWKRELARKLVSLQKPDGSWYNENNRFWEADPVLCTAFAVLSLVVTR